MEWSFGLAVLLEICIAFFGGLESRLEEGF